LSVTKSIASSGAFTAKNTITGSSKLTVTATLTGSSNLSVVGKVGFNNRTPSTKLGTTGTSTGFTQNLSASNSFVTANSAFRGDYGTSTYTINAIVKALKVKGFLAT